MGMVVPRFRSVKMTDPEISWNAFRYRRPTSYRRRKLRLDRKTLSKMGVVERLAAIREGRLFTCVTHQSCGIDEGRSYGGRPYTEKTGSRLAVALALRIGELERELASYRSAEAKRSSEADPAGVPVCRKAFHHRWYP